MHGRQLVRNHRLSQVVLLTLPLTPSASRPTRSISFHDNNKYLFDGYLSTCTSCLDTNTVRIAKRSNRDTHREIIQAKRLRLAMKIYNQFHLSVDCSYSDNSTATYTGLLLPTLDPCGELKGWLDLLPAGSISNFTICTYIQDVCWIPYASLYPAVEQSVMHALQNTPKAFQLVSRLKKPMHES